MDSGGVEAVNTYLKCNVKERAAELNRLLALPLEEKIRNSVDLIGTVLEKHQRPVVACSFGKDSMVMLHLVRQLRPDVDVVYNNTGVEFPENVTFARRMGEEWSLNMHVTRPETTFWKVVDQYGWPLLGKDCYGRARQKWARAEARISAKCCEVLKEKPSNKLIAGLGADVILLGTLATESRNRRFRWMEHGEYFQNKRENFWKCHPIATWTEADVWAYHELHQIPHCPIYDMGHKRNGCWPCGMDIKFKDNHLSVLRQTHPRLWRFLMVDKGLGKELMKLKLCLDDGQMNIDHYVDVEDLLRVRPCYFDRL